MVCNGDTKVIISVDYVKVGERFKQFESFFSVTC